MKKTKRKLKEKLEKSLGRPPKPNEIINAETDQKVILELMEDEIDNLRSRVESLEKK